MKLEIIISAGVIVVGWFVINLLTSKREFNNKKREIRIQYLIEAYRSIASAANRQEITDSQKLKIESAIEDVQLLGSEMQLKTLNEVIDSRNNDFNRILDILRNDLRQELKLQKVDYPFKFFRMNSSAAQQGRK